MNVGILERNLSKEDFTKVLAAFGIAPVLAQDHKEYECVKRATCGAKVDMICMSTC